jgi:hypothetical protein
MSRDFYVKSLPDGFLMWINIPVPRHAMMRAYRVIGGSLFMATMPGVEAA